MSPGGFVVLPVIGIGADKRARGVFVCFSEAGDNSRLTLALVSVVTDLIF